MAEEELKSVPSKEKAGAQKVSEPLFQLFNVERRPRHMNLLAGFGTLHLMPKTKSKPLPERAFSPEILGALAEGSLIKESV